MVEDEISESMAKEYNISKGKALLVKTIVEENSDLKEEQLARMTVDEIVKKAEESHVKLKKVLDEKSKNSDQTQEGVKKESSIKEKEATEKPMKVPGEGKKENPTKNPEKEETKEETDKESTDKSEMDGIMDLLLVAVADLDLEVRLVKEAQGTIH